MIRYVVKLEELSIVFIGKEKYYEVYVNCF